MLTNTLKKSASTVSSGGAFNTTGSLILGGLFLHKIREQLKTDTKRRTLLQNLYRTDPIIKTIDPDQLLEWYATLVHFAPRTSLDSGAVKELLRNFKQFGRVDIQTLKMLAETEKNVATTQRGDGFGLDSLSSMVSTADRLGGTIGG